MSDSARDDYEKLAKRQIELKRRLRQLEHQGKRDSVEYHVVEKELRQIESRF